MVLLPAVQFADGMLGNDDFNGDDPLIEIGYGSTAAYRTALTGFETATAAQPGATGGDDVLEGSAGDDVIAAGAGDDLLDASAGFDHVDGGEGSDTLSVFASSSETLIGLDSDGRFTVDYRYLGSTVISSVEQVYFVADDVTIDILEGTAAPNLLSAGNNPIAASGLAGDDTITGGDESDRLFGGADDDSIIGGLGHDVMSGQGGADILSGGDDSDFIDGGEGNDILSGEDAYDRITGGAGIDTMAGGAGDDVFIFRPGELNGDLVLDFSGNGKDVGDFIRFEGFGYDATLTQEGTVYSIHYGGQVETFTLTSATLHVSDFEIV